MDGGAGYYGQFSNGLPADPSYFPIGVWGSYNHTQANRDLDAAAGINTYVWAADNSFMPAIRSDGRFRVIQDEGNRTNVGPETAGWLLTDEIDMQNANATGAAAARQQLTSIAPDSRKTDVSVTTTTARASCSGTRTRMPSSTSTTSSR